MTERRCHRIHNGATRLSNIISAVAVSTTSETKTSPDGRHIIWNRRRPLALWLGDGVQCECRRSGEKLSRPHVFSETTGGVASPRISHATPGVAIRLPILEGIGLSVISRGRCLSSFRVVPISGCSEAWSQAVAAD